MVRYLHINKLVLDIYSSIHKISFPLDMRSVLNLIPNCRYMSYQKFAQRNNCSVDYVIQMCESTSGCTHYDIKKDRYLILCNKSTENNNNLGRQRWTLSHEIGHILCNHHILSVYDKLSENNLLYNVNPEYETEADYFAATLLSPFPLFKLLNIKSVIDVQNTFGLSCEAELYRYKQYLKWLETKKKTSWENDIIRIYKQKSIY